MNAAPDAARNSNKRWIYRCFLLRCRLVEGVSGSAGARPGWRFTIQEAGPESARRTFAYLKDVEAYLEAELESSATQRPDPQK